MRIKFTKGYQVKGTAFVAKRTGAKPDDPNDSPSYTEGQTVDLSEASARHFINRGVAEEVGKGQQSSSAAAAAAASEPNDYESLHVDELHKLAAEREIEGRSGLTTKADLIKAIEKDDKAKAAKPTAPKK